MKQRCSLIALYIVITSVVYGTSNMVYADSISDLLSMVSTIEGYEQGTNMYESDIDGLQQDIKGEITDYMTGNYKMGTLNFKDFASWGNDANDWKNVLNIANAGGSNGGNLGMAMSQLAHQFPMNTGLVNQQNPDPVQQQYYALSAQTALAARAASQADYNQIQQQINNEQQLKDQIEQTKNLKAAVDLQNRLQVENNLIQLEVLRQLSLSNQQQGLDTQANANAALLDAQLLSH